MNTVDNLQPVIVPSLNDVVYQLLRERILRREFAPGERLDLDDLERRLQVSRTPLKDALSRLQAEGLVEIYARRGTFVTRPDAKKLDEAYKIRSAYELYVALCIFKYLRPEDYQFFDEIYTQMDALSREGSWKAVADEYLRLDQQLHERLVLRGGPPRMLHLYQQTNVHVYVQLLVPCFSDRDFEMTHFEHEQIFTALSMQAPDRLNAALLNHLEGARLRAARAFDCST
ncbi:MAG: GntR family transcriptional regulator [Chloroflexi bacterium]|nr:GntR family transcriptional regulator [Chloroflexota bacterium]